ncbi:MAG: hypothetical protein U0936_17185 [Planctomycetaceae bacterium]
MQKLMTAGNVFQPSRYLLLCLITIVLGCGGESGHRISGKVTFAGAPVSSGMIYFTPDGAKGNSGQSGFAKIVNGEFDTAKEGGKPTIGGPSIVRIDGFDPAGTVQPAKGDTSGEVLLKPLFPTYEIASDLPKGEGTQDFAVPAEAAKRVDQPENGKVYDSTL